MKGNTTRRALGIAASLFAVSLFFACNGGIGPGSGVVGGPCSVDTQCQSRCLNTHDFGGGMCTVSCRFDADCPGGTTCLDKSGGVCAIQCASPQDCADFGPGWTCAAEDHEGGGQALVCRVP